MSDRDCKHGRLARSCEVCELEREVKLLSEALAAVVSVNDSVEGALCDIEAYAGTEAMHAARRALS